MSDDTDRSLWWKLGVLEGHRRFSLALMGVAVVVILSVGVPLITGMKTDIRGKAQSDHVHDGMARDDHAHADMAKNLHTHEVHSSLTSGVAAIEHRINMIQQVLILVSPENAKYIIQIFSTPFITQQGRLHLISVGGGIGQ